jgi:hypothetical protein
MKKGEGIENDEGGLVGRFFFCIGFFLGEFHFYISWLYGSIGLGRPGS